MISHVICAISVIMATVTLEMEKHSNTIPSVYYRGAVGALLIYDVTTPQSLDSLQQWWKTACSIIMKKDGEPIPAVLLANKVNS